MIAAVSVDSESLMTEVAAARFLCVSIRTLQAWRMTGVGPNFVKLGRAVRYRRQDLLDWTATRIRKATSEGS
jgi:hypothetical protein